VQHLKFTQAMVTAEAIASKAEVGTLFFAENGFFPLALGSGAKAKMMPSDVIGYAS
jgi:hypothetical protein